MYSPIPKWQPVEPRCLTQPSVPSTMSKVFKRDTIQVPFSSLSAPTFSNGASQINVQPTAFLSSRLAAIADDYDEYRLVELRYRVRRQATLTSVGTAAFYPGVVDNPPTTFAANCENVLRSVTAATETVINPWVSVPRNILAGYHPWYKTVSGTPEAAEEVQGVLCMTDSAGASTGHLLEVEGVCEFRAAAAPGTTPMDRALANRRREKQRLVQLLAASDSATSATRK